MPSLYPSLSMMPLFLSIFWRDSSLSRPTKGLYKIYDSAYDSTYDSIYDSHLNNLELTTVCHMCCTILLLILPMIPLMIPSTIHDMDLKLNKEKFTWVKVRFSGGGWCLLLTRPPLPLPPFLGFLPLAFFVGAVSRIILVSIHGLFSLI